MPTSGKCWWHVILSTHGSWLPGDPRGFRSRENRIHSSGDYKNPPPKGEHARLHDYHRKKTTKVVLAADDREPVGRALWRRIEELGHRIRTISVSFTHAHFLAELSDEYAEMKNTVGDCKRVASIEVGERYPDGIFARLGDFNRVKTREYWNRCHRYILDQPGSWTWSVEQEIEAIMKQQQLD